MTGGGGRSEIRHAEFIEFPHSDDSMTDMTGVFCLLIVNEMAGKGGGGRKYGSPADRPVIPS